MGLVSDALLTGRLVKPQPSDAPLVRDAFMRHPGFSGIEQYTEPALTEDDWTERMVGADHVVHFFDDGQIPTASILRALPKQITIAGPIGGCVDLAAVDGSGTRVMGWSGLTVNAVAEFTIALMFSLARLLPATAEATVGAPFFGKELSGSTLGIVGFGKIGRAVATKATALGMTVLAASPSLTAADAAMAGVQATTLRDLAARSNVVSVHARATPSTRHLLTAEFLSAMRPDGILVNTARPALIDLDALRTSLQRGHLGAVALDMPRTSFAPDDVLLTSLRAMVTPHMAWMTAQAVDSMLERAWSEIAHDSL